ncbi:hypothetical protein Tco_1368262 [Tanacetum coccineum]
MTMSNLKGSVNKGEMGESSKKSKGKFETMKGYEGDERIMFEFILRGFEESKIWDKIKEPLSLRMNEDEYSICCENTTRMMNALKEARMKSRELNKKDKKNEGGSKVIDDSKAATENDLAAKIKNIKGKVIGRKPKQDNTSHTMLKSILKRPSYGVNVKPASVGIEVGSCFATATVGSSFASKFHLESVKEDAPIVNKRVNFRTLINEESVANHDTVLPKAAKERVMSRYDNTPVGYFVGKSLAFQIVQNYVKKTWAKFGLSKLMKTDNGGRINFARALIEIHANSVLKKEVRMAIPIDKDDGTGYTSKVIRVEYDWKPPHCLECKLFSDNSYKCPKQVSVVDPIIDTSANDGFTEVANDQQSKKNTAGNEKASTSQASGDKSTPISNSFSVLNSNEGAVCEESVPINDMGTTHIEGDTQNPESGMKNDGGGFSLEDDDLNCYDGYDAQMNRKLEDDKIERNDKGKEKVNDL